MTNAMDAWNEEKSLRAVLEGQAARLGSKPFCHFEGETWSFSDFRDAVLSLASGLAMRGVGEGDVIGVMLPSHPDHITLIAALSVLRAIHMPINVQHAFHGLQNQLQHAAPKLLVADAQYGESVNAVVPTLSFPLPVIWRDKGAPARDEFRLLYARPDSSTSVPDNVDRVAMLTYTSGTTGAPKGALLSGRYLTIGARNAAILAEVAGDDVLFVWEPFYHLAGWTSVLVALRAGIPIAMVERFSASRCWDQVRRYRATRFHYLGGVINILLKQDPKPDDADHPVKIFWGGGAPAASWPVFERRFGVKIREGYGLSEAGNFVSLNLDGPTGSVGRAADGYRIRIMRPDGSAAPPGKRGEIVVVPQRPGMTMVGYYREPEKTRDMLRPDGVHTGDLGYMDENGWLFFSGRLKDSLRRRGENISAWEVERVVAQHPSVEDCAVLGVPSELGDDEVKLFVKVADGQDLDAPRLHAWCKTRLARFQLPRFIQFVAEFPRGPTHRIKKAEIPHDPNPWDSEAAS